MAGPGEVRSVAITAAQFNAAAQLASQPYEWKDDGDGNPEPGELFYNGKPTEWSAGSLEQAALRRKAKDLLVFEPSRVTPERRVYEKGKGVKAAPSLNLNLLGELSAEAIKATLQEALAIPSESCQERAFAEYVIRKFREIGVEARMDTMLEQLGALPPEKQKDFACGEVMPNSGNVVAFIPPTNPHIPHLPLPSYNFSFHLDRVPNAGKTVIETKGRLHTDGKTPLGADDAAGFAEIYHVIKLIQERRINHDGITITGLVGEEGNQTGAHFLADHHKVGDIALVADSLMTTDVNDAAPDIFVGHLKLDQPKLLTAPPLPVTERFRLAFVGAKQHTAYSRQGISAIGLTVQTLKKAGVHADGSVGDRSDVRALFRLQGGSLAKERSAEEGVVSPNGNQVPNYAVIDFELQGNSPEAIAALRSQIEKIANDEAELASRRNKDGKKAKVILLKGTENALPTAGNVSAILAEALGHMDLRSNNFLGDNETVLLQVNQILPASDSTLEGNWPNGWQLRSADPNRTEARRKEWEETLKTVAGSYGATAKLDYLTGGKLMSGYKLPTGDPALSVVRNAYGLAGIPFPGFIPTFGGSNVNTLVPERNGATVLVGIGANMIHTEEEYWDIEDGRRAAQVILASVLYANQFGRVLR
ncbi:MAG: hypothetical protein HYS22_03370 [Deltaproteobacteria bacterium]|nr:hypothetical protein [Deltaproteobacteria bacterium]